MLLLKVVESGFHLRNKPAQNRTRIPRIDPTLVKNPEIGLKLKEGVEDMLRDIPDNWDPHMKLEFLKVSIRTVAERLQAERNRNERTAEEDINEELNAAINALSKEGLSDGGKERLLDYIEELRTRKSIIIEEKGARLAERLGTKWYNEGEKSTRYFMRLLNRSNPDEFKSIIKDNGDVVEDSSGVKEEVVGYYKRLYEDFERVENDVEDNEFFNEINSISADDENKVVRPISAEELQETLDTCSDSSPGPDGIPYSVIRHLWQIFGPFLVEAWNHSLVTKALAPSHKVSLLKLIPKAGKDLSRLTNWRPITLSNCDHKLITKTYSKRLCESLAPVISGCQTAYLKSRLINDNIRAIIGTIDITNDDPTVSAALLALDAKKAFDSVDHKYIERCLQSFGCARFIPIFRTLYSDLNTDIIINGEVRRGFRILRGVKQGDALSCILFIMCIEPLLRNIEANEQIEPIFSTKLNKTLPKVYAYADDVNATIKNSLDGIQAVFSEYERLTKQSGLELNADKTELMQLGLDTGLAAYEVNYCGSRYQIPYKAKVKINGVLLQKNSASMVDENVEGRHRQDRQALQELEQKKSLDTWKNINR